MVQPICWTEKRLGAIWTSRQLMPFLFKINAVMHWIQLADVRKSSQITKPAISRNDLMLATFTSSRYVSGHFHHWNAFCESPQSARSKSISFRCFFTWLCPWKNSSLRYAEESRIQQIEHKCKACQRAVKQYHEWSLALFIKPAWDIQLLKLGNLIDNIFSDYRISIYSCASMSSGFTQRPVKIGLHVLQANLARLVGERWRNVSYAGRHKKL